MKTKGDNLIGKITYNRLDVSIGGGFDIGSGVFVVPTTGTYSLSFSGQTAYLKYEIAYVSVKKNGSLNFHIYDSNAAENADANNLSFTWLMNLRQGDRVNLYSNSYLHAGIVGSVHSHVTFTGELIHI